MPAGGNPVSVPTPLFRQEVIEFQRFQRDWGGIVLLQPASTRAMTWSLTTAIMVIITFLSVAQYARKETVVGYLTHSTGRAKIFAPQQGTIRAVHIQEGQTVVTGQPLLTIDTGQINAEGQDVNASITATLTRQRTSLIRQMAAEEQRGASEKERLTTLIQSLEGEVGNFSAMLKLQNERLQISRGFAESAAKLATKGYVSDVESRRRQQDVLEQDQALKSLAQQYAARQSQLSEAKYALEQLPTATSLKVQDLQTELTASEQRLAEVESRRAYTIRAPSSGRVSSLQATVGQAADPRHLQLEIIPSGSVLEAEVFIPTRAIGFVQVGQEVRLLYDAFPYQKFGTFRGRITSLSQTVLTKSDISAPISLNEPAYKATVALARTSVETDGKVVPLQPDMLLTANILLERRTVLSWLFDPIVSASRVFDLDAVKQSIAGSINLLRQSAAGCVGYVFDAVAKTQAWLARAHAQPEGPKPGGAKEISKSGARIT